MTAVTRRDPKPDEDRALHRLGEAPTVAVLTTAHGTTLLAAAAGAHR